MDFGSIFILYPLRFDPHAFSALTILYSSVAGKKVICIKQST